MRSWIAAVLGVLAAQTASTAGAAEPAACEEALVAHDAGRLDQAIEAYGRCLEEEDLTPRERAQLLAVRGLARADGGDAGAAVADFTDAVRTDPSEPSSYYGRAEVYLHLGEYERALADLNEAVRLEPTSALAYANRGVVLVELDRSEEALADYNKSIRLDPREGAPYYNRGRIYYDRERYDEALRDFSTSIKLQPDVPDGYAGRGHLYAFLGRFRLALADLDMAIELGRNTPDVYNDRAFVQASLAQYAAAVADWTRAIELDPSAADSYRELGWFLATTRVAGLRDGRRAVELALKAVALAPDDPWILDALAAAYAEAGRFDDAVRTAEAVIAMAKAQYGSDLSEELDQRLAAYRRHEPWRETPGQAGPTQAQP
jgi:tetratricopeptide (TPR) repeat protein